MEFRARSPCNCKTSAVLLQWYVFNHQTPLDMLDQRSACYQKWVSPFIKSIDPSTEIILVLEKFYRQTRYQSPNIKPIKTNQLLTLDLSYYSMQHILEECHKQLALHAFMPVRTSNYIISDMGSTFSGVGRCFG